MSGARRTFDLPGDEQSERAEAVRSRRGRRLLAAIIVVLVLALIAVSVVLMSLVVPSGGEIATPEEAAGLEWVRSIYGWGDTIDSHLYLPRRSTVDADGTIWTTDSQYKEVFAFNPEGELIGRYGSSVTDQVVGYGPVAIGPENAIYLGEPEMDRIRVLASDGSDLGSFPFPDPTDIEYRDGVMVIGSRSGFAFVDPNAGTPLKVIGEYGKGVGQFDSVGGLTIGPDGTVYLVDSYNNRLQAYSAEGELIWSVQTGAPSNEVDVTGAAAMQESQVSTAPASLQLPSDVCLDANGHLVVVDPFAFTLAVFDSTDGTFVARYGTDGRKDGQLNYPSSIVYDADRDWFVIADTGNHRVQIVRIPDSAPFNVVSTVRRSLTGPVRACLLPLVLLLIALVVALLRRRSRRRSGGSGEGAYEDSDFSRGAWTPRGDSGSDFVRNEPDGT